MRRPQTGPVARASRRSGQYAHHKSPADTQARSRWISGDDPPDRDARNDAADRHGKLFDGAKVPPRRLGRSRKRSAASTGMSRSMRPVSTRSATSQTVTALRKIVPPFPPAAVDRSTGRGPQTLITAVEPERDVGVEKDCLRHRSISCPSPRRAGHREPARSMRHLREPAPIPDVRRTESLRVPLPPAIGAKLWRWLRPCRQRSACRLPPRSGQRRPGGRW